MALYQPPKVATRICRRPNYPQVDYVKTPAPHGRFLFLRRAGTAEIKPMGAGDMLVFVDIFPERARDAATGVLGRAQQCRAVVANCWGRAVIVAGGRLSEFPISPVSYTHLTLPTILLV